MGRSSAASKKSAITKAVERTSPSRNPNLGSRARNRANGTAIKLQLVNKRVPEEVKVLIRQAGKTLTKPYPIGGSFYQQKAWFETVRNAIEIYEIGQGRG